MAVLAVTEAPCVRQSAKNCTLIAITLALVYHSSAKCVERFSTLTQSQQSSCFNQSAKALVEEGWALHAQSLPYLCAQKVGQSKCATLRGNRTACLQAFRAEAAVNDGCRRELKAFEDWRTQREALAVQTHMYCNVDLQAVDSEWQSTCIHMIERMESPMPEDWGYEEQLRVACHSTVTAECPHTLSGQGRLNFCLRKASSDECVPPDVGGRSWGMLKTDEGGQVACKIAVVSTYLPKNCGLATFTAALLERLRNSPDLPPGCEIGVIAISDPSDRLVYTDPIVHYDLRVDSAMPSGIMLEAVHFIHKAGYTHVILQQEFGLTPIMWQMADLARWLDPHIHVFTVVHSPRATPNLEERGLLRAMSDFSERLIVMTWYGWHSLVAAYGINPGKVHFIPHGVYIPKPVQSTRRLNAVEMSGLESSPNLSWIRDTLANAGINENSQVILSNGLVNQAKRLDRVIQAFNVVLKKYPNTFFLIIGREHPTEPLAGKLVKNLLEQATARGVKDNVVWLDKFIPIEDLMTFFKCSSIYLTPFDESTPTSGTLLMAMANHMPVVSTPYHFALEIVQESRGVIVPYTDTNGTLLAKALCTLLQDPALREEMGSRAQAFVENWDWERVASQYAKLVRGDTITPLNADPFADIPDIVATAKWNGSSIVLPDGDSWNFLFMSPVSTISMGVYALYADVDIQVNGAINADGELFGIGVFSHYYWVLVNKNIGIDFEWNPNNVAMGQLGDWGLEADARDLLVSIRSQNAAIRIKLMPGGLIDLQIDIKERFANPLGILGESYHNPLDASKIKTPLNMETWQQWKIADNFMFSTQSPGQTWGVQFLDVIHSNVMWLSRYSLPTNRLDTRLDSEVAPVLFVLEGPIFGSSGIAQVNRRYWMQLSRVFQTPQGEKKFLVMLEPQEQPKQSSLMDLDVLETLVYQAYVSQSWDEADTAVGPRIVFRNAWPPNFSPPTAGMVYIHQQAFEFQGIPKSWVEPMNTVAKEVWVPSEYNARAFEQSGIQKEKIFVLKHGVEFGKFNVPVQAMPLPTEKGYKFLFNGGLLPRKGIDVLLSAYTSAFSARDNVTLIIHSSYGDDFQLKEIKAVQEDPNMPEILLMQDDLSHLEMLQLYKASNVYVSPYRSEGFGLTLLEAMAMGLQMIVTNFGSSSEICPTNVPACLFVDAVSSQCKIAPCGQMRLFGEATVQQPSWSEPRVKSLKKRLQEVYRNRQGNTTNVELLTSQIMGHASQNTWYDVGTSLIDRILTHLQQAREYHH